MKIEKIKEILLYLKIEYLPEDLDKLLLYYEEMAKWNKHFSLISNSRFDFFLYQLKDILFAFSVFKNYIFPSCRIVDVGAGNGILSIPMSILFKDCKLYSIEKKQKKASFLNSVKNSLDIENFQILNKRVQEVEEIFDIITMKAFLPMNKKNLSLLLNIFEEEKSIILSYISDPPSDLNKNTFELYKLKTREKRSILKISNLKDALRI